MRAGRGGTYRPKNPPHRSLLKRRDLSRNSYVRFTVARYRDSFSILHTLSVCLPSVKSFTTKALNFNAFYQGPFSAPENNQNSSTNTTTQEDLSKECSQPTVEAPGLNDKPHPLYGQRVVVARSNTGWAEILSAWILDISIK